MSAASRWIYATTAILIAAGFLLPFWPLSVVGVALCALSGRWLFAIAAALVVDIAWGAPLGLARYLYFPLTLFAALCALVRAWAAKYFLERDLVERI